MVYAFVVHTVVSKDPQVIYYKVYSSYCFEPNVEVLVRSSEPDLTSKLQELRIEETVQSSNLTKQKVIFEGVAEKKSLIYRVMDSVFMHYSMKINHALIPSTAVDKDIVLRGVFVETEPQHAQLVIVWHCLAGLAFTLICQAAEDQHVAHMVLDVIIAQLQQHIQFLSNPFLGIHQIEVVALIVNRYLPNGNLLYSNSSLLSSFEKQLSNDLYSKIWRTSD